jgi:hypothetical protein
MKRARDGLEFITMDCVCAPSPVKRTPRSRLPSVTPLASKTTVSLAPIPA